MNNYVKQKSIFLSVIIPVFNESKTIKTLLNQVTTSLKQLKNNLGSEFSYEVIIVDDGSTDATPTILRKLSKAKLISLFLSPTNQGKGAAVRYGLSQSQGNVLLIQDADLEYHPKYYLELLLPILNHQAHIVYGSRMMNLPLTLSNIRTIELPLHFISNKFLSLLTSILYHTRITDMETCYKVFTRQAYNQITLTSNGFEIEVELTAKLIQTKKNIVEVPITTSPRTYSEGKKITYKDGIKALYWLLRYRFNIYHLGVFGILTLSLITRFANFTNRYALRSDQARDVFVGRIALDTLAPPLIGSFSSAGSFTFGPIWYYYSMLTQLFPGGHLTYWIGTGLLSTLMVGAIIWTGSYIGNRFMSLTAGLLAAISLASINSSLASTQLSLVPIGISFAIAFQVHYLKTKKTRSLFFTGLFFSLALNSHYQVLYLVPWLFLTLLSKIPSRKQLLLLSLALILPWLPMVVFDLQHQWWNLSKLTEYYRFGQHRIYLPNRWLTYAGVFWPTFWSQVVGGYIWIVFALGIGIGFTFVKQTFNRTITKPWFINGLGFLFAIIWFRYFKAERNAAYVSYAMPFIFLFTAWFIDQLKIKDNLLGFATLGIVILGSYSALWSTTANATNSNQTFQNFKQDLIAYRPHTNFTLYDQNFATTDCSFSLTLLFDDLDKATSDGLPIGVCDQASCPPTLSIITSGDVSGLTCVLVDLTTLDSSDLITQKWALVSPKEVHRITVDWWRSEPTLQN